MASSLQNWWGTREASELWESQHLQMLPYKIHILWEGPLSWEEPNWEPFTWLDSRVTEENLHELIELIAMTMNQFSGIWEGIRSGPIPPTFSRSFLRGILMSGQFCWVCMGAEVATSIKPVKELIEPNFTPEDVVDLDASVLWEAIVSTKRLTGCSATCHKCWWKKVTKI